MYRLGFRGGMGVAKGDDCAFTAVGYGFRFRELLVSNSVLGRQESFMI